MFSLYLSDITDFANKSKIFFGGYDKEFIREFNGFSDFDDAAIKASISWIPLAENAS
jgi:hypothetical protein